MKCASLITGPLMCASAKDNPMGSRDRSDKLLDAFKKDLDEVHEPVAVEHADRVYSELLAKGKLSMDRLDAAFDRMFPAAPSELTTGGAIADLLVKRRWSPAKAASEFRLPVELVERSRASGHALSEESIVAAIESLAPPAEVRARLRQFLNTALVTAKLSNSSGPILKAARKPPEK